MIVHVLQVYQRVKISTANYIWKSIVHTLVALGPGILQNLHYIFSTTREVR